MLAKAKSRLEPPRHGKARNVGGPKWQRQVSLWLSEDPMGTDNQCGGEARRSIATARPREAKAAARMSLANQWHGAESTGVARAKQWLDQPGQSREPRWQSLALRSSGEAAVGAGW